MRRAVEEASKGVGCSPTGYLVVESEPQGAARSPVKEA